MLHCLAFTKSPVQRADSIAMAGNFQRLDYVKLSVNSVGQCPYCLGPEAFCKEKEKLSTSVQLQECTDRRSR